MNEIVVYHGSTEVVEHPLWKYGRPNMEQNQSDNSTKSPVIQEIIMSNRIGAISVELARQLDITPLRALQLFYES